MRAGCGWQLQGSLHTPSSYANTVCWYKPPPPVNRVYSPNPIVPPHPLVSHSLSSTLTSPKTLTAYVCQQPNLRSLVFALVQKAGVRAALLSGLSQKPASPSPSLCCTGQPVFDPCNPVCLSMLDPVNTYGRPQRWLRSMYTKAGRF
jgi:hypothetical protein